MRELNLPSLLTLARLLLAPQIPMSLFTGYNPLWLIWNTDYRIATFVFALVLALTDYYDGFLARQLHQETVLGKRLEPIADFVYCCSLLAAVLIIYREYPILLCTSIIFACYFVWYGTMAMRLRRRAHIDVSNNKAKWGIFTLIASMLLVIFGTFAWPYFLWHMLAVVGIMISVVLTSSALDEYQGSPPCKDCTCSRC